MSKTATVRAMIDPGKKENVGKILKRMGINHSEAINIFYSLIEEYKGFPFELRLPETETRDGQQLQPEILDHLKESVKKNRRLGSLLAQ